MATTIETSPRSVRLCHSLAVTSQKQENHYGISTFTCGTPCVIHPVNRNADDGREMDEVGLAGREHAIQNGRPTAAVVGCKQPF